MPGSIQTFFFKRRVGDSKLTVSVHLVDIFLRYTRKISRKVFESLLLF